MIQLDSPVGIVTIRADSVVRRVSITEPTEDESVATPLEREVATQLGEYFAGERRTFSLPLPTTPSATQQAVWSLLDTIAFGESVSYGWIARQLGWEPAAARAVGGAVGANPVLIIRPCHRVLGANGSLTGYAGGLDAKLWLLQHEGVLL